MNRIRSVLLLSLCAFAFTAIIAAASTSSYPVETDISMFNAWLPVVALAILLSVCIVIGYYILGVVLNNARIRSAALAEFANAISTALIVVMLLIVFNFFGNAASSPVLSAVPSNSISTICTQLQNANVLFLNSNTATTTNSPTSTVCSTLVQNTQSTGVTATLDYGLVATYVITANLTNQAASNLNAAYIFNSYMNFLGEFNAQDIICWPTPMCLVTYGPASTYIVIGVAPFAGYTSIAKSLLLITTQSSLIFTLFMFQLIAILTFLFLWPYLLAAGLILRVSFLTRRLGGLLIAIAVVAVLVYPAVFLIQYTALSGAGISPIGANTFGANSIPIFTFNSVTPGLSPYTCTSSSGTVSNSFTPCPYGSTQTSNANTLSSNSINFYVFPHLDAVLNANGCWPSGSMLQQELWIVGTYATPVYGFASALLNIVGAATGSYNPLPIPNFYCNPQNAISSMFALYQVYGLMSVLGVILPVLDLMMGIIAVFGISDLLGGATDILELSRLI